METTTTTGARSRGKRIAVNALALVGFIALLLTGVVLAIYATRFAPEMTARLNGAAVALSSIFRPADEASLNVVQSPSSFPVEEQQPTATSTEPQAPAEDGESPAPAPARPVAAAPVVREVRVPVEPFGDPDLTVRITEVGYLRTSDPDSFVAAREVPDNRRGAVRFTVTNVGTNVSGRWDMEARLPTSPSTTFDFPTQRSLGPGDAIDFVLGFDRPRAGNDRTIAIEIDTGRDVRESNEGNNRDTATIDIER